MQNVEKMAASSSLVERLPSREVQRRSGDTRGASGPAGKRKFARVVEVANSLRNHDSVDITVGMEANVAQCLAVKLSSPCGSSLKLSCICRACRSALSTAYFFC